MEDKNVLGTKMCVGENKRHGIDKKICQLLVVFSTALLYVLHFCVILKVGLRPNKALSGRPLMTNLDSEFNPSHSG